MARLVPYANPAQIDLEPERKVAEALCERLPKNVIVFHSYPWLRPERAPHNAQAVAQALVSGAVKPRFQHFELAQVQAAHRAIEERRVIGKVVLDVGA